MINQTLLSICFQLVKQGKQPSVGLVKAKAKSKFHLAEIIAAVQYWKTHPDWQPDNEGIIEEQSHQADVTQTDAELILQLNQRVSFLENKVMILEKVVAELKQTIDKS